MRGWAIPRFLNGWLPKSSPKWRGLACELKMDEAGVTVKLQDQAFKVARYCAGERADPKDLGSADWAPHPDPDVETCGHR